MNTEVLEMRERLVNILKEHLPILKITSNQMEKFEVTGTIEAMQGKKKVDGMYFSTIVPKPKDVRLYFFPIYTHAEQLKDIPENLRKCLKGKSCFHIKKMDESLETAIKEMVAKGIKLYQTDGLLIQ